MSEKFEKMSIFEQIRAGLEDSIAWTKGQISLKTTTLPAPPPAATAAQHFGAAAQSQNVAGGLRRHDQRLPQNRPELGARYTPPERRRAAPAAASRASAGHR